MTDPQSCGMWLFRKLGASCGFIFEQIAILLLHSKHQTRVIFDRHLATRPASVVSVCQCVYICKHIVVMVLHG
jgi:hypothetical protein